MPTSITSARDLSLSALPTYTRFDGRSSQDKEAAEREVLALRETIQIARSRADYLESQSKDQKLELDRLREVSAAMNYCLFAY